MTDLAVIKAHRAFDEFLDAYYVSSEIRVSPRGFGPRHSGAESHTRRFVRRNGRSLIAGKHERASIVFLGGEYGTGKTMLMRMLAHRVADQVPVLFVRAEQLREPGDEEGATWLHESLIAADPGYERIYVKEGGVDGPSGLKQLIGDGRVVLMIDGLDQWMFMRTDAPGERLSRFLAKLSDLLEGGKGQAYVSLRLEFIRKCVNVAERAEAETDGKQIDCKYATLGLFSIDDAMDFFTGDQDLARRRDQLSSLWKRRVGSLCRRPIALRLLRHLDPQESYDSLFQVYKAVCDSEPEHIREAISEVAIAKQLGRGTTSLTDALEGKDIEGSRVVRRVAEQLLELVHPSIEEYFAAIEIARRLLAGDHEAFDRFFFHWDTRELLVEAVGGKDTYRESTRLAVGLKDVAEPTAEKHESWFLQFCQLVMDPWECDATGVTQFAAEMSQDVASVNPRFLWYSLYHLKTVMVADTLEISRDLPGPLLLLAINTLEILEQKLGNDDYQSEDAQRLLLYASEAGQLASQRILEDHLLDHSLPALDMQLVARGHSAVKGVLGSQRCRSVLEADGPWDFMLEIQRTTQAWMDS